ncbi:MAG: type 4a pilus biogenesis protein PilO [Pseudohongiellaceae bacterium]
MAGEYFKQLSKDLKEFDINDLSNLDTIGVWPGPVKALIALLVFIACGAAGYFFHVKTQLLELEGVAAEENNLRIEFEQKAFLATNLEAYREQTVEMEQSFAELLRQLPSETEVPGLVDDITNTGLGSGLEFANIELAPEVTQEFYIELPIEVDVEGNYHDFGTFVSGVASLPRIVTLHDFEIVSDPSSQLNMSITARTYRYKTESEAGINTGAATP